MITTNRLLLRRFCAQDWKDLHAYLSDPEVLYFEPYEPFDEERCKQEAIRRASDEAFWAVCLNEAGKVIGNLYFSEQEFGTWELGFVFHAAYQGKGYATESAGALLQNAFLNWNVRRVVSLCNPENQASWKLIERLGMRREGHLKQNVYFRKDASGNPLWQDTYQYALLRGEWERLAGK